MNFPVPQTICVVTLYIPLAAGLMFGPLLGLAVFALWCGFSALMAHADMRRRGKDAIGGDGAFLFSLSLALLLVCIHALGPTS